MEGNERREKITEILKKTSEPISGSALAEMLGVSRQVVVQDIALLRAADKNIISTNKGYMIFVPDAGKCRRVFCVKHDEDDMEDELNTIVDNGGRVLDVTIDHDVYGTITADLSINTRRDVKEFIKKIKGNSSKPICIVTGGVHYHTVEADSALQLDDIKSELLQKGYLISQDDSDTL